MQKRTKSRVQLKSSDVSVTQQNFKDKCDVNKIVSQYQKTGLVTHVARHQGRYADVSGVSDYATAFSLVKNAEVSFMELPAALRAHFNNSPAAFFDFCSNPENIPVMQELGLIPADRPLAGSQSPAEPETPKGAPEGAAAPSQGSGA